MNQRHHFPPRNQYPPFNNASRTPTPPPPPGTPTFQQNFMGNCNPMRFNPNVRVLIPAYNQPINLVPARGPPPIENSAFNNGAPPRFLPMPDMMHPPPIPLSWQQMMRPPSHFPQTPPPSIRDPTPPPWIRPPSQHLLNKPSSSHTPLSTKDPDEILIEQFLSKIGKLHHQAGSKRQIASRSEQVKGQSDKKYLKIYEAKEMQARANLLVKELEDLSSNSEENLSQISECQEELKGILSILSDEDVIADLQRKLSQRRKKRLRSKLIKSKAYQKKIEQEKKIEEAHKKSAEWQEKEKARLDTQRREEEMQTQLDEALMELRRELNTVTKSLETINALVNLRKIRLNSLKSRGQDPPVPSNSKHCSNAAKTAKEALQSYKESCMGKISSLKRFVEAGQAQAKIEVEKNKRKRLLEEQKKVEDEKNAILFGKSVELNAFDPMWPVQQLHKQAGLSLSNFVQYRRMWDLFTHAEEGSSIPIDWVEPAPPSSVEWAKYLTNEKSPPVDKKL